jgi:hypothetical protein
MATKRLTVRRLREIIKAFPDDTLIGLEIEDRFFTIDASDVRCEEQDVCFYTDGRDFRKVLMLGHFG